MKNTILALALLLAPVSWANDVEFNELEEEPQVCETAHFEDNLEAKIKKAVWKCTKICIPYAPIGPTLLSECYEQCLAYQVY